MTKTTSLKVIIEVAKEQVDRQIYTTIYHQNGAYIFWYMMCHCTVKFTAKSFKKY